MKFDCLSMASKPQCLPEPRQERLPPRLRGFDSRDRLARSGTRRTKQSGLAPAQSKEVNARFAEHPLTLGAAQRRLCARMIQARKGAIRQRHGGRGLLKVQEWDGNLNRSFLQPEFNGAKPQHLS